MAKANHESLRLLFQDALNNSPKVSWRRIFGCDAAFANNTIFGLIWKTGRIGVKLPDKASFDKLIKVPGSDPWKAGKMTMSHWVLVPETFHKKKKNMLRKWVKEAHAFALSAPPKGKT